MTHRQQIREIVALDEARALTWRSVAFQLWIFRIVAFLVLMLLVRALIFGNYLEVIVGLVGLLFYCGVKFLKLQIDDAAFSVISAVRESTIGDFHRTREKNFREGKAPGE